MNPPPYAQTYAQTCDANTGTRTMFSRNGRRPVALLVQALLVLGLSANQGWAKDTATVVPLPTASDRSGDCRDPDACVPAFTLSDDFERENAPRLESPWTDCKSVAPDHFEPLGIYDGGIVIADTDSRPGTYDTTPPSAHPPTEGRIFRGIGCAFTETGSTRVSITTTWSGHRGAEGEPPLSHVEGTPLLYITPHVKRFAFGAWPSELWGRGVIFAGYITSPPEEFEVLAAALLAKDHKPGTPIVLEVRAEEPGKVTVWVDGEQASFNEGYGLQPIEIDPELIDSTLHGFAVDSHFVDPVSAIPHIKGIEDISIRSLDSAGLSPAPEAVDAEPAARAAGF